MNWVLACDCHLWAKGVAQGMDIQQLGFGQSMPEAGDTIFSLHWHKKLPPETIKKFNIVGFHSSDLPSFRGGSPIKNQMSRGIKKTKVTAFRMTEGMDEGPILLKRDLSLEGTEEDVYRRLAKIVPEMIQQILDGNYTETPQTGEPSCYNRKLERVY